MLKIMMTFLSKPRINHTFIYVYIIYLNQKSIRNTNVSCFSLNIRFPNTIPSHVSQIFTKNSVSDAKGTNRPTTCHTDYSQTHLIIHDNTNSK